MRVMATRSGLLVVCWLTVCQGALAGHVFQIPYVPGAGWVTTITAYNDADWPAAVTLRQWNTSGRRIVQSGAPVPAHGRTVWTQEDFYTDIPATISTEEDRVRVKLTYDYAPTGSVSEIFLPADENATRWLIPNPRPELYSSLLITAANLGNRPAVLTFVAFRRGVRLHSAEVVLMQGRRRSASSMELWNLNSQKLDMVLVTSDVPVCAPIAVSASDDQTRHRVAAARRIETNPGEKRFYVPHIPGDPWRTELTLYNPGPDAATFSLHQYDDAGTEIAISCGMAPPRGSVVLTAGAQGKLAGTGSALITGRGDLAVMVGYTFGESTPAGEFFAGGDVSRRWFLPNPMQVAFDWYGVAVQNPGAAAANVIFRAYKDGREVANFAASIGARGRIAAFSEQVFHLRHWQFDMVSLESSQPVPMPLAITADGRQERHLFYEGQASADVIKPRKWAILFYDDAEFAGAFNPARDFTLEAWSGPNVDVLMLEDTTYTPTTLYYVNPNRSVAIIDPAREKNMGDPETLYDFLMKAKNDFPAERYILAVYDHGFGWQGCCIDETSNDYLTMGEMRQALSRAGGVDMLLFTAPCLMAELESVYEVRDWADVYVASEGLSTYMWFGTIQAIRSILAETPDVASSELGRRIVDSVARNVAANQVRSTFQFTDTYTISAILPGKVGEIAGDLDDLATAWLRKPEQVRQGFAGIWREVRDYADYSSVDLYDLLEKCAAFEAGTEIGTLIRKTQESVKGSILADAHGPASTGSHGLSIYFPASSQSEYLPLYADPSFNLGFAIDTRWRDIIKLLKQPR